MRVAHEPSPEDDSRMHILRSSSHSGRRLLSLSILWDKWQPETEIKNFLFAHALAAPATLAALSSAQRAGLELAKKWGAAVTSGTHRAFQVAIRRG